MSKHIRINKSFFSKRANEVYFNNPLRLGLQNVVVIAAYISLANNETDCGGISACQSLNRPGLLVLLVMLLTIMTIIDDVRFFKNRKL
jgi:hypothetical protein